MNGPFADSARRLAGLSALVLGWRPDEFWRATPAELAAIFDAFRQTVDRSNGSMPLGREGLAALMERNPDG